MDLKFLRDRRMAMAAMVVIVALVAGLGLSRLHRRDALPPIDLSDASEALQVEMSASEPQDQDRQVRCFASGQYAGMMSLAACAARNGVAPGAMDVGLDQAGAATAEPGPPSDLPASDQAAPEEPAAGDEAAQAPAAPVGVCWLSAGGWRRMGDAMTLDACVQALFSGRCVSPGSAVYGRWGGQTLRLVPGRVERSGDNRNFQLLVTQPPGTCAVPHLPE